MTSRLRRLDDGFERRVALLFPASWRVTGQAKGSGLIGAGVAYIAGSAILLVVALLTEYSAVLPLFFLLLGLVALPIGVWANRR